MARCPHCCRMFRTLEDEEGMHDCPHCGYGPDDHTPPSHEYAGEDGELGEWEFWCSWCGDVYSDGAFEPYCSSLCAARAQADSLEDDPCA